MKISNLKGSVMSLMLLIAMVLTMLFSTSSNLGSEVQAAEVGQVGVTALATGKAHTLALDSTGHVWSWGKNNYGQLGLGTKSSTEVQTPQLVSGLSDVTAIAASYNSHSLALTKDGEIYAWGYNCYGQLGQGTTGSYLTTPTKISTSYFDGKVTAIAAGYDYSMAITENGTLYTWGLNNYGQLGIGSTTKTGTPQKISLSENVKAISAGWKSAMVLTDSGKVYVCGKGGYGEMGDGTYTSINKTFKQVSGVYNANDPVVQISDEGYHLLALTESGTLWSWGYGCNGELGTGARVKKNTPQNITSLVPLNSGESIAQIDAGLEDMAVLTDTGRLLACGSQYYGKLGDGKSSGYASTLKQISSAPEITSNIINGGAGWYKRFVISDDGRLYVTGKNYYGTLGTTAIKSCKYTTVYIEVTFPFEETYSTVTFDKNSDQATGTMDIQIGLTNSSVNLNENAFTQPGYKFNGWSETTDGDVAYEDKASIKLKEDITLYAVWEYDPDQWATVVYDANTGDGGHSDTILLGSYSVKSAEAANVNKANYSFVSWNTEKDGTGIEYDPGAIIEFTSSETITLYAIWETKYYDVIYYPSLGEAATLTETYPEGSEYSIRTATEIGMGLSGQTLDHWFDLQTGLTYYPGETVTISSSLHLYPIWE